MSRPSPFYEEGGMTVYCEDCLRVLPFLDDGAATMIVTDPPYGMGRFNGDGKDYLSVVAPALRMAWNKLVAGGSMFVFASTGEIVQLANAAGANPKRVLWMYKPADMTFPLSGWLLKSEAILWFVKPGAAINLRVLKPYRHDCYVHNRVGLEGVEGHPTVKPLWVVRDLVARCPEGGVVLDPFAGSGTTLVAARERGLRAIGIEHEATYCRLIVSRLSQVTLDFSLDGAAEVVQETLKL